MDQEAAGASAARREYVSQKKVPVYSSVFEVFFEIHFLKKCLIIYCRDKDYLFDHSDPNLYSPATRSRIVEFLLKRKRFSADPDDDFAFGEMIY